MKKIVLVFMAVLVCFAFCGCKSQVHYTYSPGEDKMYYYLEFAMDNTELERLNNSADNSLLNKVYLTDIKRGSEFTVELYLRIMMKRYSDFKEEEKVENEGVTIYTYSFEADYPDAEEEEEEDSSETIETGFFFNKHIIEYDSPFNSYKKEYLGQSEPGSVIDGFKNGYTETVTLNLSDTATVNQYILNGFKQAGSTSVFSRFILPAFKDAFSAFIPTDNLDLIFNFQTNFRLSTKDNDIRYDQYGNKYYLFSTKLNSDASKVRFEYLRANQLAWYLTAVLLGLAAVGIVLLIAKYRKPKKPVPQRVNYDYFEVYKKTGTSGNENKNILNPFGNKYEKPVDPFGGEYENNVSKTDNDKKDNNPFL